jgi:hypothetical protein
MVRALSSTLTSAVAATTRVPAISVSIEDHIPHYLSYQTPGAADGWHDACVASDGSIVRVRLSRGTNIFAQSFQWQRVSNPASAGQWTTWSTFGGATAMCFQDGGCAISNNNGTLRAFVQQGTGGSALWTWISTNNGLSWSSTPTSVLTPPGSANILGIGSAGNNDVFFLYQQIAGTYTGCSFFSGGSWSSLRTTTLAPPVYGGGLAAYWDGSVYWIISSDTMTIYEYTYNPSSTSWLAYQPIAPASSAAIGRLVPRLQYDALSGLYTLIYIESDTGTGTITGAVYSYPRMRQSSDLQHWSQGIIIHNIAAQYGATSVFTPTANFLISMSSVLRAQAYSQTNVNQYLDVGNAVMSYSRVEADGKVASLELILDNNKGPVSALISQPTSPQPIGPHCAVVLREGYRTGTPPTSVETVKVGTYRITSIQVQRSPQMHRLRLLCYDATSQLDLLNRFQMMYVLQQLDWLLREICARSGLFSLSLPSTSQLTQRVPYFVLQAGQSYRSGLDELCDLYDLHFFLDQNETLQFRELSSADSSTWSYQPELELITFGGQEQSGNHVIVTGKPPGSASALTTAEAYDDANIQWLGQERVLQHVDQKLLTSAQCASKANFLLTQAQRAQVQHQIHIPLNPAHQLFDVISIADYSIPTGSGQSGTGRIVESKAVYDAQQADYTSILYLEGV